MDKEQMTQKIAQILGKLFFEDVEFFYKLVTGYARRKGIT